MSKLTDQVTEWLRVRIADGTFKPGDKLPTLKQLGEELGVSRTVIREAMAALGPDGPLESRHGMGVYVRETSDAGEGQTLAPLARLKSSFMDLLELRMAFEVHAAGLAATRRSWAQEATIWDALHRFEASLDDEAQLDHHDFVFHRSIAEATNNAAFIEFFSVMSLQIMPMPAFSRKLNPTLITPEYVQLTVVEHRVICEAISARDESQAREAMQTHLMRSHLRYRSAAGNGISAPGTAPSTISDG